MENVGAEVGQKMRSAIKAKLLELNCYADDELPDYIMVMVANKRTKSQMNEDLNLFLNDKTSVFVDWLHIVLKKLKEVTVTNPDVYKKVTKRKSSDQSDVKVKKEKKSSKESAGNVKREDDSEKSLTDDLPIDANRLSEQRKIIIVNEEENVMHNPDDEFDIPLLSEVSESSEKELEDIERKIKSVKSRLGLIVDTDLEVGVENVKCEKDQFENKPRQSNNNRSESHRIIEIQTDQNDLQAQTSNDNECHQHFDTYSGRNAEETAQKLSRHKPITFKNGNTNYVTEKDASREDVEVANYLVSSPEKIKKNHKPITFIDEESPSKKPSILNRLGRKSVVVDDNDEAKSRKSMKYPKENSSEMSMKNWRDRRGDRGRHENSRERKPVTSRRNSSEYRRSASSRMTESRSALSRLGVMSKIHVPQKVAEEEPEPEDALKTREVRSMVQVKPRILPADVPQPSKNLLLKAVAEAHRSVQATQMGNSRQKAIKRRLEDGGDDNVPSTRKLSNSEKIKLRNMILAQVAHSSDDSDKEEEDKEIYVPKSLKKIPSETPDYVPSSRRIFVEEKSESLKKSLKPSIKSRLEGKKSPSPIVFDKIVTRVSNKSNVPERLPIVHPPLSLKNKERCKYWPSCRQGDKCEFVHPNSNCENFPECRFGDKCIYLHPCCKFGASCTKRDCPYSHSGGNSSNISAKLHPHITKPQICKYFPNCTNITCLFYHPKMCRFGRYCKNQDECSFSHGLGVGKTNLTWRSK